MIQNNYNFYTEHEEASCLPDFCKECYIYKYMSRCKYQAAIANRDGLDSGNPRIRIISAEPVGAPTYELREIRGNCVMLNDNIIWTQCGTSSIADGIGDHYKVVPYNKKGGGYTIPKHYKKKQKNLAEDRWEPNQAVFISAQTGNGKTYFILNHLYSYLKELNIRLTTRFRILIISNRLALKQQIKNQLDNAYSRTDGIEDDTLVKDAIDNGIDVITYQGFLKRKEYFKNTQDKDSSSRYLYVICDEAHFFTSDAMFNPCTGEILSSIIEVFQNAIRIYMSATPYECLEYISKREQYYRYYDKTYEWWEDNKMVLYNFKRNYSYLDLYAFSDTKRLLPEIIKKIKAGEKWLIFLNDKKGSEKFAESIIEYGNKHNCPLLKQSCTDKGKKVYVVNADSKNDKDYVSMITKEKLDADTYILISTSVLDNGVNLYDVDNVVVFESSMVQCLQMAGRARVNRNTPNDRKTLYIKRDGIKDMERTLEHLKIIRNAYYDCKSLDNATLLDKYVSKGTIDIDIFRHLFYSFPIKYNEIAYDMVERQIVATKAKLDRLKQEELCDEKVGQALLNQKFTWFGKHYDESHDLDLIDEDKAKKEFATFIEDYIQKGTLFFDKLPKDSQNSTTQDAFRTEFREKYDTAYGSADKNKSRLYGIDKVNSLFAEQHLSYKLISEGKPVYWKLIKVEP